MTNYLKKSLISVFLAMCLMAVNVPISTASALKEDIDVSKSVSVDSTYFEETMPVESEPLNANDISEYEQIEKIDENAQSAPTSTERGSGTYNINSGDVIIDIEEGETCQLVATNPYNLPFKWTTTDYDIATVSSQGLLTAHKSGHVTVTASFVQSGGTYKIQCTVYVYIDVGAFYVKNLLSGYYLHVDNGKINNLTNVYQYSKYSDSTTEAYKTRQIWRLHYLGSGRYSLRPFHKLDMALDVTGTNADIYKIGSVDTLDRVPS